VKKLVTLRHTERAVIEEQRSATGAEALEHFGAPGHGQQHAV
jgi:hypothetical protein